MKFRNEIIGIDLLKKSAEHPVYKHIVLTGIEQFAKELARLNHYDKPLVTPGYMILSNIENVHAAIANGKNVMDCIVVENLPEGEAIRKSLNSIFFLDKDSVDRIELIHWLSDYLQNNPEGQSWRQELKNEGFDDINEQIGRILNCSKETIKREKRIAASGVKKDLAPTIINATDFHLSFSDTNCSLIIDGKSCSLIIDGKSIECTIPKIMKKNKKIVIEIPFNS